MTRETVHIEGVDYEVIVEQDDGGGGYDWQQVALIRDPVGRLLLVRDGGCSCNGPWDDVTAAHLTPVSSWQEAVEQVKADMPWSFDDDDVARLGEKLMALQPAPSVTA